jgi:hypothetical protein
MLERDDTNHLVYPGHDTEGRTARRLKFLPVVCLAALSIAYLAKGFFFGAFLDGSDVLRRWLEERFVLGEYINSRIAAKIYRRIPASFIHRGVFYPPWSYFSGALLFGPHGRRCEYGLHWSILPA